MGLALQMTRRPGLTFPCRGKRWSTNVSKVRRNAHDREELRPFVIFRHQTGMGKTAGLDVKDTDGRFFAAACTQKEVDTVFESAKKAQKASLITCTTCCELSLRQWSPLSVLGLDRPAHLTGLGKDSPVEESRVPSQGRWPDEGQRPANGRCAHERGDPSVPP